VFCSIWEYAGQPEEKPLRQDYENLAMEGGGVWGMAYAGALEELDRIGILARIKRVAGTSAGSITALPLALGYSSAEIYRIISELNFAKFLDRQSIKTVLTRYGLHEGEFATSLFQDWVAEKLGSREATFRDLHEAGGLDLRVYATDLNTKQIREFSFAKTSGVPLAAAVRASMSVPLFFTAPEIDGHLYIDGGTVFDYPITGFGAGEILHTLGLAFSGSASVAAGDDEDTEFGYSQPAQYIRRLATVIERIQAPVLALHGELKENTILIDTGKINSLNFRLSEQDKNFLIESGRRAVQEFFQAERVET
jgi:NTE family protein